MNIRLYIACSLTHVPRNIFEEYTKSIHLIAEKLNVFDVKYALVNSDPQLGQIPTQDKAKYCYLWDRKMVEDSDVVIAEASFPSIGLGIELQIAEAKNIPIILIYRDFKENKAHPVTYTNPDFHRYDLQIGEVFVTLMALGLPNILRVIPYHDIQDCIRQIKIEMNRYAVLTKTSP